MPEVKEAPQNVEELKGAFQRSLYRNNKAIKQERADSIIETAQMKYKRTVEDLALKIKQARRDLDSLLDLSPTDTHSLIMASDFNADAFIAKDSALRLSIYEDEIRLKILGAAYKQLFGEEISI